MKMDPSIKIKLIPGVYPPSDDSYLLIESIDIKNHKKALDMGCGTGIVALHLAKNGLDALAVDKNERAVENTIINSKINGIKIKVMKSDLFENVRGTFDLITFNPPYLPTKGEDPSWDGGIAGIEIIDRFLRDAYSHLREEGEIYMVVSSFTDIETLRRKYGERYGFEMVKSMHIFFEDISSYRIHLLDNNSLYNQSIHSGDEESKAK